MLEVALDLVGLEVSIMFQSGQVAGVLLKVRL